MKKPQTFSACTLKDLCPEDKQKVSQLIKQVVELGKENQQLKASAANAASSAEDKLRQVQACNKQAVIENCSLKNKLGQAITVLRMYHHKVQGLDAALRALQHTTSADASTAAAAGQQEQKQQADAAAEHAEPLPLPAPAQTAEPKAHAQEQQQQQQSKDGPVTQTGRADSSSSEDAGCVQRQGASSRPQSSSSVQQPAEGTVVLGRPMPQLWDTPLFAGQQVLGPSALLRFDATQGAYVLQGLPTVLPPQLLPASVSSVSATGSPAAFASPPASASMQQLSPEQAGSLGLSLQVQAQQQQQQQEDQQCMAVLSTGGAATAAAAAAASSALAAVRAAAAACAAPIRQQAGGVSGSSSSTAAVLQQHCEDAAQAGHSQHAGNGAACTLTAAARGSAHVPAASGADVVHAAAAAVEEVPVVDMAQAPVHVLVQNEKSASSLRQALGHVTVAGVEAASAAPAALSASPATATAAAGCSNAWGSSSLPPTRHNPRSGDESNPACAWQPHSWHPQQRPSSSAQQPRSHAVLQERVLQAHDAQHGTSLSSSASPPPAVQQQWILGLQAQQQLGPGAAWGAAGADSPSRQRPAGISTKAHLPARVDCDTQVAPAANNAGRSRKVRAGAAQQQQLQRQQQYPEQQQQQLGAAWWGPPVCNTRELLQRFDESLVDILAEVERLEQQQQLVRQQLQQPTFAASQLPAWQQEQQQREHSSYPHQQEQLWQEEQQVHMVSNGAYTAAAPATSIVRPPVVTSSWLDQKQAHLQQRLQCLQQEDMRYEAALGRGRRAALWQQQQRVPVDAWTAGGCEWDGGYDADDVSEILNHMD